MEISTKKEIVQNHEKAARIIKAILAAESSIDREKEHFWVIGMNSKLRVQYVELVTLGLLSTTLVHPREVFRFAILKGVASIILAHNHPSGDLEPSEDDIKITEKLVSAGELLSIPVLDHIIVVDGNNDSFSFKANDLIQNKRLPEAFRVYQNGDEDEDILFREQTSKYENMGA